MSCWIKLLNLLCIFFLIISCTTKTTTDASSEINDNKEMSKTAKINAQLGIAYLERNEITRAKQKLLLALQEGPTMPETWYSMAYFYEATGDKEKANQHYLRAISLAPTRGESHNNYGTFLCRQGQYQPAIQHFLLAAKDTNYLSPADAYENAGLCALKTADQSQAEAFFNKAIMQDPNRPVSFLKLAQLNYKHKKYADAKKNLEQFSSISPPTAESTLLSEKLDTIKT